MTEGRFSRRFDNEDRRKLTDSAYEELKNAIIQLRFRPGDVLRESAIGAELGVSKTPIREALLRLEQDGLVELIPFRGAKVRGYSIEDVRNILDLRAILQSECVRRVAQVEDADLIEKLRHNVAESKRAEQEGDALAVINLFDEFDSLLLSQLDNQLVASVITNLQDHMMRIGQLTAQIPGRDVKSIEEHNEIIEALESGDADAAGEAMRRHIQSVLTDEVEALEHQGESGSVLEDQEIDA